MNRLNRRIVITLLIWQIVFTTLMTLGGAHNRTVHAIACMVWGLNLLWIGGAGVITYLYRDAVRIRILLWKTGPAVKFLLMATIMVLVEEMVTTLMTNCAPLFGVRIGEAYITASTNYLDVIAFHSVVVIVPQLAAWAWMATRYAFRPFSVFLLYGLTGFLSEAVFAHNFLPIGLAQWILVYGLMVYLPAYCLPELPDRKPAPGWRYLIAVFIPMFASIPVVLLIFHFFPHHPSVHFRVMN